MRIVTVDGRVGQFDVQPYIPSRLGAMPAGSYNGVPASRLPGLTAAFYGLRLATTVTSISTVGVGAHHTGRNPAINPRWCRDEDEVEKDRALSPVYQRALQRYARFLARQGLSATVPNFRSVRPWKVQTLC